MRGGTQKARPPQSELLRTGVYPWYHLNSALPRESTLIGYEQYPIALTGEPVAAYLGKPRSVRRSRDVFRAGLLPPRTTRRFSEGRALPYLFPVIAVVTGYHGGKGLSRVAVK